MNAKEIHNLINDRRPKKHNELFRRIFGDAEVREATAGITVVPKDIDIRKATKLDFTNCALARAFKRMYGGKKVAVLHKYAYVEMPDKTGKMVVFRYVLPDATAKAIETFDKTGKMPASGFRFEAPTPSLTLNAKKKYWRKYRKAIINGTLIPEKGKYKYRAKKLSWVRNGTGMVHFNAA